MDETIYKYALQTSPFGYTFNELVVNENNIPINYIIRDSNQAFATFIGTTREALLDKPITEFNSSVFNDSFNWLATFASVALTGERTEFDAFSSIMNRYFHFSVSCPKKGFFIVISIDITQQKEMTDALARKEEERRQYFDNTPDGLFITDENYKYIDVNEAGCRIVGYTQEELKNLHIPDLIPTEENSVHRDNFKRLLSQGKSSRVGKLKRKDGTLVTVLLDAVKMKNGRLLALCKDLSGQERLEAEKKQYYLAFQSSSQPILITNADGTISSVNDAFIDMYGYPRDEIIGQNPHFLNPGKEVYNNLGVSYFEYDFLFRDLWQAVKDPNVKTWKGEIINRKKNGSLLWISLLVNALYDENNELTSIVGMPIDMTVSHDTAMSNRIQLFQTIADLAELRDDETGNHMKRVGLFAKLIARSLGMNQKYCNDIEVFAPMHDIGKVGILDSILRAPRKLTPEEFAIMKTHTTLGHNIVKGKAEFEMAAAITLCHHERFDGTGYPNGLSGKHIPQSAQITAIADVYDALRSKRPYKDPWPHDKTVEHIREAAGSHFDPDIVEHFLELHNRFDVVFKELSD